jgi:hypothetical protein
MPCGSFGGKYWDFEESFDHWGLTNGLAQKAPMPNRLKQEINIVLPAFNYLVTYSPNIASFRTNA